MLLSKWRKGIQVSLLLFYFSFAWHHIGSSHTAGEGSCIWFFFSVYTWVNICFIYFSFPFLLFLFSYVLIRMQQVGFLALSITERRSHRRIIHTCAHRMGGASSIQDNCCKNCLQYSWWGSRGSNMSAWSVNCHAVQVQCVCVCGIFLPQADPTLQKIWFELIWAAFLNICFDIPTTNMFHPRGTISNVGN